MPIIKNINELNERIDVITVKTKPGPMPGEDVETIIFSCWAKIRTQNIKDVKEMAGTTYDDTLEIVIRQDQKKKITTKMLVGWQGNKYNVVKVNPDTAFKDYMVLLVKQKQ
ncbi:phage head closure protein [Enterococcus faecium]|uniref:phage head closure protein n=1 Tax=Enterococcus TaxID=1350 RepID=UPI001CDCB511|nr:MULTISPECIES: phage head closure protein [Enterococcus]MCM6869517.1 phage head closure protein [Enterococcus faecium]MCM6874857.1 phage head closure protein [Enterococcus faecium]MCM6890018.1 phage head closure protein [Enterococcus faecium]MCM6892604.1 phage head closure protein [Enterococcus faecium]MCM6911566.1 phage head closure protein [Enterococcus faecium]